METTVKIDGKTVLIDKSDWDRLSCHEWHIRNDKYVYRATRQKSAGKWICRTIMMHKEIMPGSHQYVDHKNGNTLDNRRSNLRPATMANNMANAKKFIATPRGKPTSKYKGVCLFKKTGRWRAVISVKGKQKWLGDFEFEKDAAMAYDRVAVETRGDYALTNKKLGII